MGQGKIYKEAVMRVYFDRHGKAERVVVMRSSGDKLRDRQCQSYCEQMVISVPRIGKRLSGELWREIRINPEAVFVPVHGIDGMGALSP